MKINIRRKTKNEKKRKNTKTEEWKMENEKRYTKNEKQKKFKNATSVNTIKKRKPVYKMKNIFLN